MRFLRTLLLVGGLAAPLAVLADPPKSKPDDPDAVALVDPTPLPAGAKMRLGSTLFRVADYNRHAVIMPDGKSIAKFVAPDKLEFLGVETGKVTKTVKLKEQVQAGYTMALSPTGERMILTGYNMATVIDPKTGEITGKFQQNNNGGPGGGGARLGGRLVAFESLADGVVSSTGDAKLIAFGTRYPQQQNQSFAYVFNCEKNEVVAELKVLQQNYIGAVLSHDGKTLASFGQYYVQNNEENVAPVVQIWDVATKKEVQKVRTNLPMVQAAKFSPDGKTLYTGGQNGPVEAWDVATGQRVRQYITRSNVGQHLFLSADGKRLAGSSSDGCVQVWEADTGKRLGISFAPTSVLATVALPPDGPAVAFGQYNQTMQVWQVPGKIFTPQNGHFGTVNLIQYTADGKQIVTAGHDGRVVRWDAATGAEVEAYGYSPTSMPTGRAPFAPRPARIGRNVRWTNSWNVGTCAFSPDTGTIYVQGGSGGVTVVDLATGQEHYSLYFPTARNHSGGTKPALSADGRRVGAAGQSYDRNKYIFSAAAWDTETGQPLAEMKLDFDQNQRYFNGMATAITPDGAYFGVACMIQENNTGKSTLEFNTFDLNTGVRIATTTSTASGYAPHLHAAPDNRSALSNDQQSRLIVWDLPTGKVVRTLAVQANTSVQAPAFHPSGRTFAMPSFMPSDRIAGGNGAIVRVYEWASGEVREDLPFPVSGITALTYSPDGNTLAVGWQDSTVLLFDANVADLKKPWDDKPSDPSDLWEKLSGKSAKAAWLAMRELTDRPDVALKLLRENVKPVPAPAKPTAEQTGQWIAALDAPAFAAREQAMKDLRRLGKSVEKDLKKALETTPSAEVKERIEKLLGLILRPATPNPTEARAVELLERIGTADAKAELTKLAAGDPASLMTQDAATTLKRLAAKK